MGIKLDWEIESDHTSYNHGEHPEARRRRRAARRRLIFLALLLVIFLVGVTSAFVGRLAFIQNSLEQQLRDTVMAEVNALKVGNIGNFLSVVRSESEEWNLQQRDRFWEYQRLKLDQDIDLTGRALDITIDEPRARVFVEEVIDGQRYQVLWFYFRYQDGWRHVPRDVAFWGEESLYEGDNVRITYFDLDESLVDALAPLAERFWSQACSRLGCATSLPTLHIQIVPDPLVGVGWSQTEANTLLVSSPLTGRASIDSPLGQDLRLRIGQTLAERVLVHAMGGASAAAYTDAAFLQQALQTWLTWRFLDETGALDAGFIASLIEAYGEGVVPQLVAALRPDSTIAVLGNMLGVPLDAVNVDWGDFFQWRLALEPVLAGQGNAEALYRIYDTAYGDMGQEANTLLADPAAGARIVPSVVGVQLVTGIDGAPRACVLAQQDGIQGTITFRLVENVWLRSASDPACG